MPPLEMISCCTFNEYASTRTKPPNVNEPPVPNAHAGSSGMVM